MRQVLRDATGQLAAIRFDASQPFVLSRFGGPGTAAALTTLRTHVSVDLTAKRPLAADGQPIRVKSDTAAYVLSELNGQPSLELSVIEPQPALLWRR